MNATAAFTPDTWRRLTSRRNPDMDVEDRIVATLVADLLAHNETWHIDVFDGEDQACQPTRDPSIILAALFSTDEDWLRIYDGGVRFPEDLIAWVRLVGGNGCDIISDYTTNIPDEVMARANAIAAQYH